MAWYSFSGSILPKFEHKLRRDKQTWKNCYHNRIRYRWKFVMIMVAMTSELSYNEMTPLLILLAAVFLSTGKCSRELFPPIAASMFVKFKSVIEIFWDEDFMVRNTVKKRQSWFSAVISRRRRYRRAYSFKAPLRGEGGGFLAPPQRGLNLINNQNETSGLFEKGAEGI